jgi:predicted glutamine amidotransferase
MCTWLASSGSRVFVDELIHGPELLLIDQSLSASSGDTPTSGDGCGIGRDGARGTPGWYWRIRPAPNGRNLGNLAEPIESGRCLAHSRAATANVSRADRFIPGSEPAA